MSITDVIQHGCTNQINMTEVLTSRSIGKVQSVFFKQGVFFVKENGGSTKVHSYDVHGLPRNINAEQLKVFFESGFLRLSRMENGDIVIRAETKGLGGSGKGDPNQQKSAGKVVGGIAAGAAAGAAIGGAVAGPPGAVVGGFYGAGVGGAGAVAHEKKSNK